MMSASDFAAAGTPAIVSGGLKLRSPSQVYLEGMDPLVKNARLVKIKVEVTMMIAAGYGWIDSVVILCNP